MQSTFAGIEIGKRSLVAHSTGFATIGHNLSNASVEGYSRQRVQFNPFEPIYFPGLNREETAGQIGQGIEVTSIKRVHDSILQQRIVAQSGDNGYWEARSDYLLQVEQVYNEPGDYAVRELANKFWNSWQELSLYPEKRAARQTVIESGNNFIAGIQNQYQKFNEIREGIETDVFVTVEKVNTIITDIAALNEQIVKVEALGDNPNDLLDRRDLLATKLAKLINITVDDRDPDEYTIFTGGMHLVQGTVVNKFSTYANPKNEGFSDVMWDKTGEAVELVGGRLTALVELRDVDVRGEIQKLDSMTMNMVDLVNEIHSDSYGLNGKTGNNFFNEYPFVTNTQGNYDSTGDGTFDKSYVFRINGTNSLELSDQIGIQGTMKLSGPNGDVEIEYNPTDTVKDIINRINLAPAEVTARLNRKGQLQIKASTSFDYENPDFVIRHVEDSGYFLTGYAGMLAASGPEGAYTWNEANSVDKLTSTSFSVAPVAHPSRWMGINEAIKNDPDSVAAGFGYNGRLAEVGDNTAALAIAELETKDIAIGNYASFDDYFATIVAEIGLKGQTAQMNKDTEDLILQKLNVMRESNSGVNIDEELSQMIKFQHGYNAASRFITEIDKMLDTIINRMGA